MLTKAVLRVKFAHCKELLHILKIVEFGGACLDEKNGWLDLSSTGYVGNHISATRLNRHCALLCSAQI